MFESINRANRWAHLQPHDHDLDRKMPTPELYDGFDQDHDHDQDQDKPHHLSIVSTYSGLYEPSLRSIRITNVG